MSTVAVPTARKAARSRGRFSIAPYLFLAPFLILFIIFLIVPLLYALQLSVFKEALIGGVRFVGLGNYQKALSDKKFWDGILLLLRYGVFQLPIMLGSALLLALILDSGMLWARAFFRLGLFLPYAVPTVIAALLWGYLYGPLFGPLTQLADYFGWPRPDLLSKNTILFSTANVAIWELTGYFMIIYFAALQAIPPDFEEAAVVSGARAWQYVIYVKLPLIRGTILVTAIFALIGTLQLFSEPFLLQGIAPSAISDNYTPNMYAYTVAFVNQDYNYSAAISFVLGAVVAVISYVFQLVSNREGGR